MFSKKNILKNIIIINISLLKKVYLIAENRKGTVGFLIHFPRIYELPIMYMYLLGVGDKTEKECPSLVFLFSTVS